MGEVFVGGGESLGQREVRQLDLAELDADIGSFGDPQGVVARLGVVAEQIAHLVGGLEVVLLTVELEALRVRQHRARLDTEQGVVGLVVLAVRVVRIVGGEQRSADPPGELDQLRVGPALFGQAVVLQLDEQVVAPEDVLESGGLLGGSGDVATQQRLEDVPAEAPGGGDDALGVIGEQLPIQSRLVVVTLEERP